MKQKRPSFWGAIVVLIIVAGLLVWWTTSLTNSDFLWFLRVFTPKADWITIYLDGETIMLLPSDPGYDAIMEAFSKGVAQWVGYEGGVGFSRENFERYLAEERLVAFHYNAPVQVHTRYLFPRARNFYVPLSGTHAYYQRVFAGLTDMPRVGVLNMSEENFERLLGAVEQGVSE